MFCPNCGTQNDSAATPCKKCGFKLSGISAPKFKGTMLLNSDQTVQERIEEHRRKQAPGGVAEKAKGQASEPAPMRVPSSSVPPSPLSSPRGPVLQPPRAAPSSRGRMGGTMMGVAPQAGGLLPPKSPALARPPSPDPASPAQEEGVQARAAGDALPGAPHASEAGLEDAPEPSRPDMSPAEALAGTVAVPLVEPAAAPPFASVGVPSTSDPEKKVARTQPLAAVPHAGESAVSEVSDAGALDPTEGEGDEVMDETAHRAAETQPPRNRAVAATKVLPPEPEASTAALAGESQPVPAGIRPLDVVLIVCTLGLYGVVLWFKQRKRPA